MSLKSDFLISWKNIETQIKLDAVRSLKTFGKLNVTDLTRSYNSAVKKWETNIYYEGEWLDRVGNDEFKREFLRCINNISFNISASAAKNNYIGGAISVAGFAGFWILKFAVSASWPVSIISSLAVIAVGAGVQMNMSRSAKEKYKKQVNAEITKILNSKRDEIGRLCDRYDR